MKRIAAKQYSVASELLGRATFKIKLFQKKSHFFICRNASSAPRGYAAVVAEEGNMRDANGNFCLVGDIHEFHEGDVCLIDKQGGIVFLYENSAKGNAILATERCNQRCITCPQPPIAEEEDRTSFNLKLIDLIDADALEIGITGGEPTLIGDKLFLLIKRIKKRQPHAAVTLLTNGVRFAEAAYAAKLAACRHPDLQIDVPIHSDIAEEHNRIAGAETFYQTIRGLHNLAKLKQRIGIRIVVHKQNCRRLPQLAEFIWRNLPFVSQVAFMQMECIGMAEKNFNELWIDPFDFNQPLREAVISLRNRRIRPLIYNSQLCILPEDVRIFAQKTISDWKNVFLPECSGCSLQSSCCGFFDANRNRCSKFIRKIQA